MKTHCPAELGATTGASPAAAPLAPRFRTLIRSALLLVCCAAIAGADLRAQPAPDAVAGDSHAASMFSVDYLRELWGDTTGVLSDPLHWTGDDWGTAGVWTGATLLAAGFDHSIRQRAQTHFRTRGEDRFFKQWENVGAQYSFVEIALFEGYGVLADNRNAQTTAMDALSASIIAGGIITPVVKYSVGRYRPSQTTTTFKFRPFSGHQSFPSGHATQAFAVATVVAGHYTEWWEQALSYGAATLVGVARVQQNGHWASDVVAGSAIGWAVGRAVVHRHELPGGFALQPWFGNGEGLMVSKDF